MILAPFKQTPRITRAYVFCMNAKGQPQITGVLSKTRSGGTFSYHQDWLNDPHSYPIDPVNLPLTSGTFYCNHNDGVFPVFSDAAPDSWGTRIMLLNHKSKPQNELERLLWTSGQGVGALRFSLSRSRPMPSPRSQSIDVLNLLAEAADNVDNDRTPTDDLLRLIEPGSSMGGARPKTTLHDGNTDYIAKFSKTSDIVDVPVVEYATMTLLAQAGLLVPNVRLVPIGKGRSAFLIERFDSFAGKTTHHYVSAHALFNVDRLRLLSDGFSDPAGYIALSRCIRGHAKNFEQDGKELFLRALTNIALGNTDDHARNFGLRLDLVSNQWSLAPVFDVLPITSGVGNEQAMSLGTHGRESSLQNLLSAAIPFGLTHDRAVELSVRHLQALSVWEAHFQSVGVTDRDLAIVKAVVQPKLNTLLIDIKQHCSWNFDQLDIGEIALATDSQKCLDTQLADRTPTDR